MRKKRRTKKKPTKEVVVVDDEEVEEEREQAKEKETMNLPTSLDQVLATAFSLNSASPNLTAIASTSAQAQVPPVASGSTRRLRRDTRAESLSERERGGRHHITGETPSQARPCAGSLK